MTRVGIVSGPRYRGGVKSAGEISYGVSLQVNKDASGAITKVRGVGRITKVSKVAVVQVDSVVLGTASAAVLTKNTPVNGDRAPRRSAPRRGARWLRGPAPIIGPARIFSVRWADGALSKFSSLSPLTRVCRGVVVVKVYANCAAMNVDYPHGVGRPGVVDKTSGTPVTNYFVSVAIYNANVVGSRRGDKDGIACEKH